MSLTSTQIGGMSLRTRAVAMAYRLGWNTPPSGTSWDNASACSLYDSIIRWHLFPLLEPATRPDGPATVICSAGPYANTTATFTQIAEAGGVLTGVDRVGAQSDMDYLGITLAA